MNTLSWLIYFADIVANLQGVLGTAAIVLLITVVFTIGLVERPLKEVKWVLVVALFVGAIATVLPSKNTVYAIAASELGEQVLVSNTGKKAVAALEAWLDAQVKGLK